MCADDALDHPALLYETREELLGSMVPYVEDGLEAGEPVFVAARADNVDALREVFDGSPTGVIWADTEEWHPHPANRLRAFHEFVVKQLDRRAPAIRLAGEPVWPPGPTEFVREWQRCESILNVVLAPFPVTLMCLYDSSRLDPSILSAARRTHPRVRARQDTGPSDTYQAPEDFVRTWNAAPEPPPPWARPVPAIGDLSAARAFLNAEAVAAGLSPDRASELSAAGNEVLTNAVTHGGGVVVAHTWTDGERFVCQIDDRGPGVADPLAGYRPPSGRSQRGYGLWLARQLVDLLQVASGPQGTSARLHMRRR